MPPIGALLLCLVVVLWFLHLTTGVPEGRSRAVWIPTFWILICASRPIGRWFAAGSVYDASVSDLSGSIYDQVVLGALILLTLVVILKRGSSLALVLRKNRWACLFFLFVGASVLWSGYPVVSLKRFVKVAGTVLCAIAVFGEAKPLEAIEVILRRTAYVLMPLSVVLIKYFPKFGVTFNPWSGSRMATGVCLQKNQLGALCSMAALFFIWELIRKGIKRPPGAATQRTVADICVLMMALYLLKGADTEVYSATSIGVLAVGLCLLLLLARLRTRPSDIMRVVWILAIAVVVSWAVGEAVAGWSPIVAVTRLLGRDETLTGRVDVWDAVFSIAPRWSMLGTGFGGFWGLPYTYNPIGLMSGHNGYLDVYVELGAVGAALLSFFLLDLSQRLAALAPRNFEWSLLGVCYFVVSLVYNYSESDFLSSMSPFWPVIVLISFAVSAEPTSDRDASSSMLTTDGSAANGRPDSAALICRGDCIR